MKSRSTSDRMAMDVFCALHSGVDCERGMCHVHRGVRFHRIRGSITILIIAALSCREIVLPNGWASAGVLIGIGFVVVVATFRVLLSVLWIASRDLRSFRTAGR